VRGARCSGIGRISWSRSGRSGDGSRLRGGRADVGDQLSGQTQVVIPDLARSSVQVGPRLRGVAGTDAEEPFDRWQEPVGCDHAGRRRDVAAGAGGGCDSPHPASAPRSRQGFAVAGRIDCTQAAEAGGGGTRQQNRSHRLEDDGDGRTISLRSIRQSRAGLAAVKAASRRRWRWPAASLDRGSARRSDARIGRNGEDTATQALATKEDGVIDRSVTRETPRNPLADGNRRNDWNGRRETHLGQRPQRPHSKAGHMDASDRKRRTPTVAGRAPSTYGFPTLSARLRRRQSRTIAGRGQGRE